MPRLLFLLLTTAALATFSTAVSAKDIPGTPKILIGEFAEKPESRCTGVENPNPENGYRYDFGTNMYNTCGGKICDAHIFSHTKTKDGFILKVRDFSDEKGAVGRMRIIVIGKNRIKVHSKNEPTLHRCPARHW